MSDTPEVRRVDSDLERRRLLYILSETLEKVSRLQKILRRQQIFIRAEHAEGESGSAVDTLIDYLDKHCQMFLGNSERVASLLRSKPLNEAQERAVIRDLEILISRALQVHELLLLLPREAAEPQASFAVRDCFGCKDLKTSVVLTNFITAYEYRFEDILEKVNVQQEERETLAQGGSVLCQAFADKDNPLAWAVLAHEYGHTLDDSNVISRKIVFGEGPNNKPKSVEDTKLKRKLDWDAAVVAETVADFVAAHVLGPASLMPILFVEMMQPRLKKVEKISAGHPPTPLRVRLVREYLKSLDVSTSDFEAVFEAYDFDYARKLREMEKGEQEKVETTGSEAEGLLSPLVTAIASRVTSLGLRRFEERNARSARILRNTLASRQPISSRRGSSNEEIFAGLISLRSGQSTAEQAYGILKQLDEEPVASSEILTAGWLYRLSSFEGELMKAFPEGGVGQKADFGVYASYVEKTDFMLLKSLELTAVHAEVLRQLAAT